MAKAKKWTRNQKLLLTGLIITIIFNIILAILYYIDINKQITIRQDIDNLKSKYAEINTIKTNTIINDCQNNTSPSMQITDRGMNITCS